MKKLLFGLFFLASNGWGAIVIGNQSTSGEQTGTNTPITWNMTIGVTDNFVAVGCVAVAGGGNAINSVSVGGNAATLATSIAGTDGNCAIFYKVSPLTGSQTISVTDANGGDKSHVLCTAISLSGVNASAPIDVSTSTAGPGLPSATKTTTVDNDLLFDVVGDLSGNGVMTQGGSQVLQGAVQGSIQGASSSASTLVTTTAGSKTMSWTPSIGAFCQSVIAVSPSIANPNMGTITITQ